MNHPLTGKPVQKAGEKTGRASDAYWEAFGAHLRGRRLVEQGGLRHSGISGGYGRVKKKGMT